MKSLISGSIILFSLVTSLHAEFRLTITVPIGKASYKELYQNPNANRSENYDSKPRSSLAYAIVPGLYQLAQDQQAKGWGFLIATIVSIPVSFAYSKSSEDWQDRYYDLGPGHPSSVYDRYYNESQRRRSISNGLLLLSGATYMFSWFDAINDWSKTRKRSRNTPTSPDK